MPLLKNKKGLHNFKWVGQEQRLVFFFDLRWQKSFSIILLQRGAFSGRVLMWLILLQWLKVKMCKVAALNIVSIRMCYFVQISMHFFKKGFSAYHHAEKLFFRLLLFWQISYQPLRTASRNCFQGRERFNSREACAKYVTRQSLVYLPPWVGWFQNIACVSTA